MGCGGGGGGGGLETDLIFTKVCFLPLYISFSSGAQRVPGGFKSRGSKEPFDQEGSWDPLWGSDGSIGPWNPLKNAPVNIYVYVYK